MTGILETLQKRAEKYDVAYETLTQTNKELATFQASSNSVEELLSYEARMRNILLQQQKNLENLKYRAEKYYSITDHDNRQTCRNLRVITEPERKQIKKTHEALETIKKDIKTALNTNTQMLDQNLRNSDYIKLIIKFNHSYELFTNECQGIYKSEVPHEVPDNISSRSKELEELLDRLGPLSASSTLNLNIDWEIQRQDIVRQSENVYFFKDDYSNKYAQAELLHKEFLQLSDLIIDPNTTDEERILNNQKLGECRNTLSPLLKELQAGSGRLGIDFDWISIIENMNHIYEDVQFDLRTQAENLSELIVLFQNQPSEYVHKSQLYQSKLLRQKQYDDAVNYGIEWMKSIPKEASNDDLMKISSSFIQAATLASNPNWTDYRKALELQLEQRDLHLTDQKLAAHPEITSGDMGRLELIRGTLFANAGDLSFSANKCYRNCELISPNDTGWKFQAAKFYISAHQWEKARAIIPNLPSEAATIIRKSMAKSESDVYSFVIDAAQLTFQHAPLLFPKLAKNQTFKTTDACIQISTRYFKELGVPFLTIDPQWPERRKLQLMGINLAFDILDFYHERIPSKTLQQGALFGINAWRVRSSLSQLAQSKSLSVFSVMNTASTFASVGLRYPRFRNPTFRTICMTTQKIQMDIAPLGLIAYYWETIVGFSKQLAISTTTETQFDKGSAYLDQYADYSTLALSVAVSLCAAHRFTTYHPQIWTAMIIGEAQSLFDKERYQESKILLRESQNSWHGDTASLQLYADYIDSLERVLKLISEQEIDGLSSNGSISRQKKVADQLLKAFKNISNYSVIHEEVYYNEIVIALRLKDKERTETLLKGDICTRVLEQTAVFFLHYLEAQGEMTHKWVDELFPQAYKDIITKYREYVSLKKKQPILTETSPQTVKEQRFQAIDALLQLIKHKDGLDTLYVQLHCDRFFVYFNTERDVLNHPQLTTLLKQMTTAVHKKVALTLIEDAERLFEENEENIISPKLQKARGLSNFHQKTLIEEHEKYLTHRKAHPQLTNNTTQEKDERLKILDNILSQIESDNSFSPLITGLRWAKVRVYLDTESFKEVTTFLKQVEDEPRLVPSIIMYLVQAATDLDQKEEKRKATKYLVNAAMSLKELLDPTMVNILELFRIYLVLKNEDVKSDALLNQQIEAMKDLLNCIQPIRELRTMYVSLSFEQFTILISEQRYELAKMSFDQHSTNRQVRLLFIGFLADHLIQLGEKFIEQNRIDNGKKKFLQLSQLFGISEHKLITSYFQLLDSYQNMIEADNTEDNIATNKKILESIHNLSEEFNVINYPIPGLLIFREAEIHNMIGGFEENNENYELSLKAYQSVATLYEELGITDPRLNNRIMILKNKLISAN